MPHAYYDIPQGEVGLNNHFGSLVNVVDNSTAGNTLYDNILAWASPSEMSWLRLEPGGLPTVRRFSMERERARNNKKKICISEAERRRTINYENRCKDLNGLLHPMMNFFFLFDKNDLWSDRVQLSLLPFCLAFWLRGEGQEFCLWAFVSAECGSISLSALFTSLSIKGLSATN